MPAELRLRIGVFNLVLEEGSFLKTYFYVEFN